MSRAMTVSKLWKLNRADCNKKNAMSKCQLSTKLFKYSVVSKIGFIFLDVYRFTTMFWYNISFSLPSLFINGYDVSYYFYTYLNQSQANFLFHDHSFTLNLTIKNFTLMFSFIYNIVFDKVQSMMCISKLNSRSKSIELLSSTSWESV
jgi:hypothetical protein